MDLPLSLHNNQLAQQLHVASSKQAAVAFINNRLRLPGFPGSESLDDLRTILLYLNKTEISLETIANGIRIPMNDLRDFMAGATELRFAILQDLVDELRHSLPNPSSNV